MLAEQPSAPAPGRANTNMQEPQGTSERAQERTPTGNAIVSRLTPVLLVVLVMVMVGVFLLVGIEIGKNSVEQGSVFPGSGSASGGNSPFPPHLEKEIFMDLGGGVKMKFVLIPTKDKKFWMGSPRAEQDYVKDSFGYTPPDENQHEVEFGQDFYIGVFEAKQKE